MSHRLLRAIPALVIGAALALIGSPAKAATDYYVAPSGSDSNSGTSTAPFATIQKALNSAPSGATVHLAAGTYLQDAVTTRAGVTISGPATAIVKGAGNSRIFQVRHDNTTMDGFTIDGLFGSSNDAAGYRDKLIYAMSTTTAGNGVDGLTISNMTLKNAGGECVRLRYLITGADLYYNKIGPCGVHDFKFNGGGKNGEGIYVGTAPEQQGLNGAPDDRPDVSRDNRIHHNTIKTAGNECVDVKENSTANIVENNYCTQQLDPNSGGLDARGNGNTFRYNNVYDNVGAGIRLGGDTEEFGINNNIYGNTITGNDAGGIKFMRTPQGQICGNTMSGNTGGNSVGTYGSQSNPTGAC